MSSSESETFTGEFVTLSCADGLELDAIWIPGIPQTERALIHIHGKGGTSLLTSSCGTCTLNFQSSKLRFLE